MLEHSFEACKLAERLKTQYSYIAYTQLIRL